MTASVSERVIASPRGWMSSFWAWLFQTRNGYLSLWTVFAVAALVAVLWADVFGPLNGLLDSSAAKIGFLGATSLVVLPIILLFLSSQDNLQSGPGLALPVLSLFVLVTLTAIAVLDNIAERGSLLGTGTSATTSEKLAARVVFFIFLAVAFIPNVWNAAIFAEFEEDKRKQLAKVKIVDPDLVSDVDAEATSALLSTVIVIVIGFLAYLAGLAHDTVAFENFYGLVLCGIVIGVFAVVVFIDTLSETEFVQTLSRVFGSVARSMRFLAVFYDWVDTAFVRIGAGVAGMGHETVLRRYGLLAGSLTCLTLLALYLPPPLGLVPATLGFVMAISVSRLWSWVEEDRALAAMTEYRYDAPYRVGFREDFRDETLLGFIFVFILLPIAMMQAHVGQVFGPLLFDGAEDKSFLEWFGFFGIELAKAVPIIDWAEIYDFRPANDLIQFNSAASKHTVFLARAMVDLVLIASLLQALGIATRNRNQKRLFAAGHINRLDELVERSELVKAVRSCRRNDVGIGSDPLRDAEAVRAFELRKLGHRGLVNFRRYNEDRLKHLYWSMKDAETRTFIAALSAEAGRFLLSSAIDQTREIAAGRKDEVDMVAAFTRALAEHQAKTHAIDINDIYDILSNLRWKSGLRDFKHKLIDLGSTVAPAAEAVDRLSDFAGGPGADSFQYTRRKIAWVVAALAPAITDRAVLEEVISQWESWPPDSRPGSGDYEITLTALRAALGALPR
jgi:hypothetical protein